MRNIEQELKLLLDEREYNILYEQAGATAQLQINYYFGYPSMDRDVMVRLRQKSDGFTLCYKRRMSHIDGVMVSNEREIPLTDELAHSMLKYGISSEQARRFFDAELDDLRYLGRLDTYRAKFQLEEWTLELDKNVYFDRVDYELECENTDIVSLNKLKNYLYYKFGVVIKAASPKVQRFMHRAFG